MSALTFDSMTLRRELESSGMERRQAESVVAAAKLVHDIQAQETANVKSLLEASVKFKDSL